MDSLGEDNCGESKLIPNVDVAIEVVATTQPPAKEVGLTGQAFERFDLALPLEPASDSAGQRHSTEVHASSRQENPAVLIGLEEKGLGGGLCGVRDERDGGDKLFAGMASGR